MTPSKRTVLYGIALLVGVWLLSRWDTRQSDAVGAFVEQAERSLAAGKAFRARSDSLRVVSQNAQRRAQAALSRTITLSASIDSLKQALPRDTVGMIPGAVVDSVLQVYDLRDSLRLVAIAQLQVALSAATERADSAEARVAQLEAVVRQGITVADCHLLGIGFLPRCPSRLASFAGGIVVGVGAVLLVR